MIGVNLSGAEFGKGDRHGWDYKYPTNADLRFFADQGITLFRLPVRWERLQPEAGGALNPAELARLKDFLVHADAVGGQVIIDLHNYGRHDGRALGSAALPEAMLADFWVKLAREVGDMDAVLGYDLMNEPHGMPHPLAWPTAAQLAVDALRAIGDAHLIYVEGEHWAGAANWAAKNPFLDIRDPLDQIVYEAHIYFDRNASGTYRSDYDAEGAYPELAANRLKSFANWLAARDAKGFIGEFGVPSDDPRWQALLHNLLDEMARLELDGTYWGAGWGFQGYKLGLQDADGAPTASLATLLTHVGDPLFVRPALLLDGSAPADQRLSGTDGADIFRIDSKGRASGDDVISKFDGNDLLTLDAALRDGNRDRLIQFNDVIQIDGTSRGDTLTIADVDALRSLGSSGGRHLYADAATRPLGAKEGTVAADVMAGDQRDAVADIFFFDTALDIAFGHDRIVHFGRRDILVTTTALSDGNGDGIILFNGQSGLALTGDRSTTVRLTDAGGRAVSALEYDGTVAANGVDYHVYSMIGSAAGSAMLHFA